MESLRHRDRTLACPPAALDQASTSSAAAGEGIPAIRLKSVSLFVDNARVLSDVNLSFFAGEVHALVGDRGSGKSAIAHIVAGKTRPTEGVICFEGNQVSRRTDRRALAQHVALVHQSITLIDNFTIAENLFLPNRTVKLFPFVSRKRLVQEAELYFAEAGFSMPMSAVYNDLSLSEKTVVSILRAIMQAPKILIIDDVLERLTTPDVARIAELLRSRVKEGMALISISHRIDDVYNLADRVSIIRNGSVLLTDAVDNLDRLYLLKLAYSEYATSEEGADHSNEFYQLFKYNEAILKKLPINLIVTDPENKIRMINDFGREYFARAEQRILNRPLSSLFRKNKGIYGGIEEGIRSGMERTFYNIRMDLREDDIIVNIKIYPIYDRKFHIGTIVIIEDISEQERLRQHLILSEKLASVGLLAAGVAHEINNPLEIIYNYLSYLRMNPKQPVIGDTVGKLEEEIDAIKQIVSNLIFFSDNSNTGVDSFDVNEIITSLLDLVQYSSQKRAIDIVFTPFRQVVLLRANKVEIRQVVLNLLKNSIEALENGGRILITTNVDEMDQVIIKVADTGPDIDPSAQGSIFLPFYSTKKQSETNLGLGLSVSYGIVKKYSGTIAVNNRPGGGCEFAIVFPLVR